MNIKYIQWHKFLFSHGTYFRIQLCSNTDIMFILSANTQSPGTNFLNFLLTLDTCLLWLLLT